MEETRKRLLEKIEDLKKKIETNEDFPESKQDVGSLDYIEESIDDILASWYY